MVKQTVKACKTNTDIVAHIMEWGSTPMVQSFIIDAITKHSKQVIDNEETVIEQMKDSFVSGELWVHCAKEIKGKLDEFYNSKK